MVLPAPRWNARAVTGPSCGVIERRPSNDYLTADFLWELPPEPILPLPRALASPAPTPRSIGCSRPPARCPRPRDGNPETDADAPRRRVASVGDPPSGSNSVRDGQEDDSDDEQHGCVKQSEPFDEIYRR